MNPSPRRKDYVDPQVQGQLARRLALHWVLFMIAAALLAVCLEWIRDPLRSLPHLVWETSWNHGPFLLLLIALVPLFVYDSIKLSHRFAGPVYRLRKAARALAEGELPEKIELRDTDFWHDLAADFNQIMTRISMAEGPSPDTSAWLTNDGEEDDDAVVAGRIESDD
jgi:hypothetical protein